MFGKLDFIPCRLYCGFMSYTMNHNLRLRLSYYGTLPFVLLIVILSFVLLSAPVTAQNEKAVLEMNVIYDNYNNTVKAGQDNIIYIEIRNSGNVPLNNIVFSYLAPEDWEISFNPDTIEYLNTGNYSTIEVNIKPAANTSIRNNSITVVAQSTETRQTLSVYARVENTTGIWLWIGIGIAVAAIAMFIYVYFRLNRKQ